MYYLIGLGILYVMSLTTAYFIQNYRRERSFLSLGSAIFMTMNIILILGKMLSL